MNHFQSSPSVLGAHLNSDQGPGINQILSDVSVAPEAGVVEWRVPVLIDKVHICLVSEKLEWFITISQMRTHGRNG